MSDDRAGARTGPHRARHRGSGPTSSSAPRPATRPERTRPANPLASKTAKPAKPVKRAHRDSLTPDAAMGAVWYTRWSCALTNVIYGLGFVVGAPTGSSTYQAMQTVAPMWAWGTALIVLGPLLVLGRIAIGAPLTAIVWLCFAIFNARSTAWGVPVFALPAALHCGMVWYVTRGRAQR